MPKYYEGKFVRAGCVRCIIVEVIPGDPVKYRLKLKEPGLPNIIFRSLYTEDQIEPYE